MGRVGGVAGTAVFIGGAAMARRGAVSDWEARAFRVANELPAALFPAVWTVMQAGSLGGVGATGAIAAALHRRSLAWRLLAGGTATWGGAKLVKKFVRRGRPSTTLDTWRTLGRPQHGLGYPSGHAAVSATIATIAAPHVPPRWRPLLWAVPVVTGTGRVYVGAHLPLDIVGGAGLGCAIGALAARA